MKGKVEEANLNASSEGGSGRGFPCQENTKIECRHLMLQIRVFSIHNHSKFSKCDKNSQCSHMTTAYSTTQISFNKTATSEMSPDNASC